MDYYSTNYFYLSSIVSVYLIMSKWSN